MRTIYPLLLLLFFMCNACRKYLDEKPDKKLQVPSTLADCQALMANSSTMNGSYPYLTELAADNYILTEENWNGLELKDREAYIWKANTNPNVGIWSSAYARILICNQVLATLDDITPAPHEQALFNTLKGTALFYRAFSYYGLAQVWAAPYRAASAATDPGIPLRLTPDVNEVSVRGTVAATYDRITSDLEASVPLLSADAPATALKKTLPVRAAAQAALARVYLCMEDYTKAAVNARAALQQYSILVDYNQLTAGADFPLVRNNAEVLLHLTAGFTLPLYYGAVSPALYAMYDNNDLRKKVFFRDNGDGSYTFKGGYNASLPYVFFCGFTTDELYLVQAECAARANQPAVAMDTLNRLLAKRYNSSFVPYTASDATQALTLVLRERRKELPFRGLRWEDLRRLNYDPRFAITVQRQLGAQLYTLAADDLRYVFLIPTEVLARVALTQNPR